MKNTEPIDEGLMEDTDDSSKKTISPKRFTGALSCLLDIPHLKSDKEKATAIALKVLLDCHHPFIGGTL